jgi:hypothetical protein
VLYLQSFSVDWQVPWYLCESSVGAVNCKATARACPWAPRKFPHLMTLGRQDTAYDMSTAYNNIITTVGCCSHKNHHNVTTHRHGQNLSRDTHTHTKFRSHWFEPPDTGAKWTPTLGQPQKSIFCNLQRADKFLRHFDESVKTLRWWLKRTENTVYVVLFFTFYRLQMKQHTRGTTTRP